MASPRIYIGLRAVGFVTRAKGHDRAFCDLRQGFIYLSRGLRSGLRGVQASGFGGFKA